MYLLISYKIAKFINIKMVEKKIILIFKDISNKQIDTKIKKDIIGINGIKPLIPELNFVASKRAVPNDNLCSKNLEIFRSL